MNLETRESVLNIYCWGGWL